MLPDSPPRVTVPAKPQCRNAPAGSFNHECGKPATYAVTYWAPASYSYPADWFTSTYCAHCFEHGTDALRARSLAGRIDKI